MPFVPYRSPRGKRSSALPNPFGGAPFSRRAASRSQGGTRGRWLQRDERDRRTRLRVCRGHPRKPGWGDTSGRRSSGKIRGPLKWTDNPRGDGVLMATRARLSLAVCCAGRAAGRIRTQRASAGSAGRRWRQPSPVDVAGRPIPGVRRSATDAAAPLASRRFELRHRPLNASRSPSSSPMWRAR